MLTLGRTGLGEEIRAKLARVRELLACGEYSGALFTTQGSVAWVTAGIEDRVLRGENPSLVWALVTPESACLITSNVEAPRLWDEEQVAELPEFSLQTFEWHAPQRAAQIISSCCDPARIVNDGWGPGTPAPDRLQQLRMDLTPGEQERLSHLGKDCCEVLEATLEAWKPGASERYVAGQIAAGLEEQGIFPSVLLVAGDGRRRRFRHPVPTDERPRQDLLGVLVGVRGGLNVALSRTVSAGEPDPQLSREHEIACSVEARLILASRPGRSWQQALDDGISAYAAAGVPEEWTKHYQGGPIGYQSREFDVVPGNPASKWLIQEHQAVAWNPTVGGAKSEDTFVIGSDQVLPVTNSQSWPTLIVDDADRPFARPGILRI
jgi:Xaa-Pro dipeptidase